MRSFSGPSEKTPLLLSDPWPVWAEVASERDRPIWSQPPFPLYPSTAEELPRGMRQIRGGGEAEMPSRDQDKAAGCRDGARLLIQALGKGARGSGSGPRWVGEGRCWIRQQNRRAGRGMRRHGQATGLMRTSPVTARHSYCYIYVPPSRDPISLPERHSAGGTTRRHAWQPLSQRPSNRCGPRLEGGG